MEPIETTALKGEARKALDTLQSLRDEIRLQIHLAGMDAKDRWRELEPRIETALGRAAEGGSELGKTLLQDLTEELQKLRASLRHQ